MLGDDVALGGDDPPQPVGAPHDVLDLGEALDLGAQLARRLGIGVGDAGRVEMPVLRLRTAPTNCYGSSSGISSPASLAEISSSSMPR